MIELGNLIASCREYTKSRTHRDSEAKLWKYRHTETGPVLDVKVICHQNVNGIEIQIPSTSGDNIKVWVDISRSSNRYVDELRYREPPSFDFLLGCPQPQCVRKNTCHHTCIRIQTCDFKRTGGCQKSHDTVFCPSAPKEAISSVSLCRRS